MIMYDIAGSHLDELHKLNWPKKIMYCKYDKHVWVGNSYCMVKLRKEVYEQVLSLHPELKKKNFQEIKPKNIKELFKNMPELDSDNKIGFSDVTIGNKSIIHTPARVYQHSKGLGLNAIDLDYISYDFRRYIDFYTNDIKSHIFGFRKDNDKLVIMLMPLDFKGDQINDLLNNQLEEISLLLEGSGSSVDEVRKGDNK